MTQGTSIFEFHKAGSGSQGLADGPKGDVLVVTADPVSRIVIAGTVQRMGKRCRTLDFSTAAPVEDLGLPELIIFDCSDSGELCQRYAGSFSGRKRPKLIVISDSESPSAVPADLVLHKPIIPDRLEQAILTLIAPAS